MATKKTAKSGLGEPDVQGADALFAMPEPEPQEEAAISEDTQDEETKVLDAPEIQTKQKSNKAEKQKKQMAKTSLYLSEETLDQLHDLKKVAKKQEGRFVPTGELIEWAVSDLAKRMLKK